MQVKKQIIGDDTYQSILAEMAIISGVLIEEQNHLDGHYLVFEVKQRDMEKEFDDLVTILKSKGIIV